MRQVNWFLVGTLVLLGGAIAMAADAVTGGGTTAAAPVQEWWKGLLGGIGGGILAAMLGWWKNKDAQTGAHEAFDTKYLWPTMLVGALVGIAAWLLKMSSTDVLSWLESSPFYAGITVIAEMVLKAIFRHTMPLLKDILAILKGGMTPNPTVPPVTPLPPVVPSKPS